MNMATGCEKELKISAQIQPFEKFLYDVTLGTNKSELD